MAFVYCDDRWKINNNNKQPGPGQYSLQQSQVNQKTCQRPFSNLKKTRRQRNSIKQEGNETVFKEWINCDFLNRKGDERQAQVGKQKAKKGKLYRSLNNILKKQQQSNIKSPFNSQCKFKIKNAQHNQSSSNRNKWGNLRIVQLLSHQKLGEESKKLLNKQFSRNILQQNCLFTYKIRQQFQNDLKELQTLFNSSKNHAQNKINIKTVNRQISAKQKRRQTNSHTFCETINNMEHLHRSNEGSAQNLQIFASAAYRHNKQDNNKDKKEAKNYQTLPCTVQNSSYTVKDQSMPTGYSQNILDEDSIQYIDDATPGPGSYNLHQAIKIKPQSKIQKFGVTMQRFKVNKKHQPQISINPAYPEFKKSSQAEQEKVGFGRAVRQQKQNKQIQDLIFYEDINNLENAARKMYYKSYNELVGFGSCKQRFQYSKRRSQQQQSQYDQQDEIQQEHGEAQVNIPTSVFLSKVRRQFPVNSVTEDVDFAGQNYNCLAHKIKTQKQYLQDYQLQPAPFLAKDIRFRYQQPKKEQDKKEEFKVEKIKQLKKKKQMIKKKFQKGYSFGKQNPKNQMQQPRQQTPSPNKYINAPAWVKPSYNIRFS